MLFKDSLCQYFGLKSTAKALYVLELNAIIFLDLYYTYIGIAYFKSNDFSISLINYKKSLPLNSENKSAVSMIQEIEGMKK